MDEQIAHKIITVRAHQSANRGWIEFEEAVQEGWIGMLTAMRNQQLTLKTVKERNLLSICARNQIVSFARKELSSHGMTKTGGAQTRKLYNPLIPVQRAVDTIVHTHILAEVVSQHILPVCPHAYTNALMFYLHEAESETHWQFEYAQHTGMKPKRVNRYMASLRRRIPEMVSEYYQAKRNGETPNLRFMKDRGDIPSQRVLSFQDEQHAIRLHASLGLQDTADHFRVEKKVILTILSNHRRRQKRRQQ